MLSSDQGRRQRRRGQAPTGWLDRWSPEREAAFRSLWAGGKSMGQIAAALGVSRCAVAGKARRLRAESEGPERRRDSLAAKAPKPARPAPPKREAVKPAPDAQPLAFERKQAGDAEVLGLAFAPVARNTCRWISGDPCREFRFCSEPCHGAFCPAHAARAYRPWEPVREPRPRLGRVAYRSGSTAA